MFKQIATIISFIAFSANVSAFEIDWNDVGAKAKQFAAAAGTKVAVVSCSTSEDLSITRDVAAAEAAVYSEATKVVPPALGGKEISTKAHIATGIKFATGGASAVLSVGCLVK